MLWSDHPPKCVPGTYWSEVSSEHLAWHLAWQQWGLSIRLLESVWIVGRNRAFKSVKCATQIREGYSHHLDDFVVAFNDRLLFFPLLWRQDTLQRSAESRCWFTHESKWGSHQNHEAHTQESTTIKHTLVKTKHTSTATRYIPEEGNNDQTNDEGHQEQTMNTNTWIVVGKRVGSLKDKREEERKTHKWDMERACKLLLSIAPAKVRWGTRETKEWLKDWREGTKESRPVWSADRSDCLCEGKRKTHP